MKKIIIGIVAVILLGAVFYVVSNDDSSTVVEETNNVQQTGDTVNTNNAGINSGEDAGVVTIQNSVVLSPAEGGNFANVDSATLTKPGYIVIYQVDSNNDTDVIGNSDLLEAGTYANINIQLDGIIVSGQTIVAVLHEDDGDGEFEFPEADFYLGNTGEPVVSDVDVVDVPLEEENEVLEENVKAYLEAEMDSSVEAE